MSKVLVTGGTGFVAGWCIVKLLAAGHEVRTTVRRESSIADVRATVAAGGQAADGLDFAVVDLTADAGWAEAMAGCDYVLHVASPMNPDKAGDADAYIRPAREGVLRVLRTAAAAGVKRVVMTSSCAACNPDRKGETFTDETVWTDPASVEHAWYRLSKVLAERAAWEFMEAEGGAMELVTILPAAIFGPALGNSARSSLLVIDNLLFGKPPGVPKVGMCVTDVRDLADMHVAAMTVPDAAGERFIIAGDFLWMKEIADVLRKRLGAEAAAAPKRQIPDFLVRISARTNPNLHNLLPMLGRKNRYDSGKAQRVLGYRPTDAADVVADTGRSLVHIRRLAAEA